MSPYKNSEGHVLVCHHDDLTARGLAALLREASSPFTVASATSVGEIVKSLESGLDLIVLGKPGLALFECASNEAFQRGISVSLPKVVMLSSNIDEHLVREAQSQSSDLQDVCRDEVDVQIISLIIQGYGNEEIALKTFIAVQTVRNRISRLLAAAGAKNRTQLAIMFSRDAETHRDKSRY
jgi:DNA-binding NarL/FixJ family response regulator